MSESDQFPSQGVFHVDCDRTSGDLLFNLPAQKLDDMRDDVKQAVEIGLDQICLYHLIMFRGLGTIRSRDEAMLSSLPGNEEAAENWLSLRQYLIDNGFQQTSLTNFERRDLADARRYRYEPISYESSRCQVLGFGPAGISYSPSSDGYYALKTMNPESSAEYQQSVHWRGIVWNRYFQYHRRDLELLHFTRRLAALHIDKATFSRTFGMSAWKSYSEKFDLFVAEGLLDESRLAYSLTPRGMFFSDSIAALLADGRWQDRSDLPRAGSSNDNRYTYSVAFSPDGLRVAAAVHMRGTLIWDVNTGELIDELSLSFDSVKWTKDGRYVMGGSDGSWGVYDTREGRAVFKRDLAFRVRSLAIAPDGRSVLLGGSPRYHHPEDSDFALQHWQLPKRVWPTQDLVVASPATSEEPSPPEPHEDAEAARKREQSDELVEKGHELLRSGRFNDAARKFKEAIGLNPKNAAAYYGRAKCSMPWSPRDEGQHRTVMRYLDQAIRLDPTNADYRAERGLYLQERAKQKGDDDLRKRAIEDLTAAIQLRNDQYWWWFQRAWLRAEIGLLEEADTDYREVIELLTAKKNRNSNEQTHLAWAYLNNCANLIRHGDIPAAMEMGDQAVAAAPGMPKAHWNRARAYMAHHDFRTALDAVEKAIESAGGNYADAYVVRAMIHEFLGDIVKAYQSKPKNESSTFSTLLNEKTAVRGVFGSGANRCR